MFTSICMEASQDYPRQEDTSTMLYIMLSPCSADIKMSDCFCQCNIFLYCWWLVGGKKKILYCVVPLRKIIGWVLALAFSHTCTNPMLTNSLSIFDLEEAGGHKARREIIQLEIIGKNSMVQSPFYGLGDFSKQNNSTYLSCFLKEFQISSMKQLRY